MKKTKLLLVLVLMAAAVGCRSKPPSAEERLQSYLSAWARQDYEAMYGTLSSQAKSALAKEAFVQRHRSIYDGIAASRLEPVLLPAASAASPSGAASSSKTADRKSEKAEIVRRDPVDGATIRLTVDAGLQRSIYSQMAKDTGAGAAIHPLTGEVLALVSVPSYDPNVFVSGVAPEQWKQWTEDARKPLLNRFARTFAPGSAFKPITGAIALQTGTITPELTRTITGKHWRKDASWGNYDITRVSEAATSVDLLKGLLYSDNIYFAQTALELGSERFMTEAGKFGFGEQLPLPYPFDPSTLATKFSSPIPATARERYR